MQIDINKDTREIRETIFFGLTMRQCICSVLAILTAIILYFMLQPYLGTELVSWVCMLGAAPFAAMGFFSYHGMTAEQFFLSLIRAVIVSRSELQCSLTDEEELPRD